jgi:hypothetical protein
MPWRAEKLRRIKSFEPFPAFMPFAAPTTFLSEEKPGFRLLAFSLSSLVPHC